VHLDLGAGSTVILNAVEGIIFLKEVLVIFEEVLNEVRILQ
jgi:hypothetical protein